MDDAYKDMYISVDKKRYRFMKDELIRLRIENEFLREKLSKAERKISDSSWETNPDRMGGSFTEEEKNWDDWRQGVDKPLAV